MKTESPLDDIKRRNVRAGAAILAAIWGEPSSHYSEVSLQGVENYCSINRLRWMRGEVSDSEKLEVAEVHIATATDETFVEGGDNNPRQPVWSGQITLDADMTHSGREEKITAYVHRNQYLFIRCAGCDNMHPVALSRFGYCTQNCLRTDSGTVDTSGDCPHCGGNGRHRRPGETVHDDQVLEADLPPCLFCEGRGNDAERRARED